MFTGRIFNVLCALDASFTSKLMNSTIRLVSYGMKPITKLCYSPDFLKELNIAGRNTRLIDTDVYFRLKQLKICRPVRGCRSGKSAKAKLRNLQSLNIQTRNYQRVTVQRQNGINFSNLVTIQTTKHTETFDNSKLKFCLLNSQSARNKSAVLADYVCDEHIDVAAVTETWFHENDQAAKIECTPTGYKILDKPRIGRTGGGIAIVYRENISAIENSTCNPTSFELSEWTLTIGTFKLLLVLIYRPPYSSTHPITVNTFIDEFADYLETLVLRQYSLLICGDFNIHVDDVSLPETKQFTELLESNNLQQHVQIPTHIHGHTLDLIITRKSDSVICTSPDSGHFISDHCAVLCHLRTSRPKINRKVISFRKIDEIDIDMFKSDLLLTDLVCSYAENSDLINCYSSTLTTLLDKHAPVKTKLITNKPKLPWMSDDIKALKRQRRKAEKKWRDSNLLNDRSTFCKLKNKVVYTMNKARREYYTNFVTENCQDQRKLFRATSKLLKPNTCPVFPDISSSTSDLANGFGSFFSTKIKKIREKLDATGNTITSSSWDFTYDKSTFTNFKFLSPDDVLNLINKSTSKTCRLDPLPTKLLKTCKEPLLPVLTKIVNDSLQSGIFPDSFKKAIVTPIMKKPNAEPTYSNYRPVSNLSFVSKLIEKAVFKQIHEYLTIQNLYPSLQSAYRTYHSTETALLKIKNDILLNMNKQHVSLLILLDLSAAFDTVDYNVLENRLFKTFGISGVALNWFKSYVQGRSQRIVVEDTLSTPFDLECGVPQGSCLGPLLFTLYASPLLLIAKKHLPSVHCFADDTQLHISFKPENNEDQSSAISAMENCIEEIRNWMTTDKLLLNEDKTEFILIGTKQQLGKLNIDHIQIGSAKVPSSSCLRNLGSWFDEHLTMKQHVIKISGSSFYHIHNLRRIRKYLSKQTTETLVHALISCRIDYCNSLLYGIPDTTLKKLQRVQNAAARLVSGTPRFCHITPVLAELHWLPVAARIKFKILLLTFKAINGQSPDYICNLITPKKKGRYALRSNDQNMLEVPSIKSLKTLGDRSFYIAAPTLWNNLPSTLRSIQDINCFKGQLKTYLFKLSFNIS